EAEDLLRDDGFSGEFLDHYMLDTRFGVTGFAGAYWCADDAEIDGLLFTQSLARAAENAGARIFEGTSVKAVATGSDPRVSADRGEVVAARIVVTLNAFAGPLVPYLAERIQPLRGQCIALAHDGHAELPSPAYG